MLSVSLRALDQHRRGTIVTPRNLEQPTLARMDRLEGNQNWK
jgi:hypothetical protein